MRSLKKVAVVLLRVTPFLLCAAVFLSVLFFPKPKEEQPQARRVVRIWNVDTFEGGKGSRTAFLKKVALRTEKKNGGVYYLVNGYTAEGAETAIAQGDYPDILSFGVGLSAALERSLPLSYRFAGGQTEDGCYAYPWCRGGYALFSLTDNFEETGATAISCGGSNLPQVAAALAGITGEETESLSAYMGFLSGSYRYLLGTQRDLCRFSARGVQIYTKPLTEFCDLFQYISVLSVQKREDCLAFMEELLSDETQKSLADIGMFSVSESGQFIPQAARSTVNVFSSKEALDTIKREALISGGKNISKYLKNI